MTWDESKYKRVPAGQPEGGQFTHKDSIAAIERAVREASGIQQDTLEKYRNEDGTWEAERQKLHDDFIDRYFKGKTPVKKGEHVAVIMGVGAGAGKSTLVKEGHVELAENSVISDPDSVIFDLPEMMEMIKKGDKRASEFVHEESSYLSKVIADKAAQGGYNLVLDGTSNDTLEKLKAKVDRIRASGAKVQARYVTVGPNVALEPANARARETGRVVPRDILLGVHRKIAQILPKAVEAGFFDDFKLFDTGGPSPVLIAEGEGKVLRIINQKLYEEFLKRGKRWKFQWTEWRK